MAALAETQRYIPVDELPEVAMEREAVRQEARETIEDRRQQQARGDLAGIPLPIDALGTANKVKAIGEVHGKLSPQYKNALNGLALDCSRLIGEWYRKKKPEYFEPVFHQYDATTEDFYSHGMSLSQMTYNALVPHKNDPESEARRVNERVEEATPHLVRKAGGLATGRVVKLRTISECTDKAIKDYASDLKNNVPHRGYGGYVPEIKKMMIRDFELEDESGGRDEEQVALPGIYLVHEVVLEALKRRGVNVMSKQRANQMIDKTELQGMQLLVDDDLLEDFVPMLDEVASEQWCVNIFMGEVVPADHPKNYAKFREEARLRKVSLEKHSLMVADFVMQLTYSNTDPRKAPEIVEEFVKQILMNKAKYDISLAADIFDQKTADGLSQVAYLESAGLEQQAMELYQEVLTQAPGGGYCGAGSCGLEAAELFGKEAEALKKLGFDPKDTIQGKDLKCKCGSKGVYFDLRQAKKGCVSCGKTAKY